MHVKRLYLGIIATVIIPLAPFLVGYFPATGDIRDVFIPLESFFREQQLQGNIPSWNPAVSFGFPVLASAQIGFFYPPLFVLRFLPIYLELPLALVLHIAAMAIGTFLFARRLSMSKEAAFFSAIAFTLSQFVWQHITHLNIFLAIAWLPWQMWAAHILFQKQKMNSKDIAVLGALFGIPFLIGQFQIQLLAMGVALLYGITLRWKQGSRTLPSIGACVVVAITALLLASVQLFPTFELTTLSSRSTNEGFDITRANQHSYPLYHLPTLLFPRFYGNDNTYWGKRLEIEYGSYIGVIPLILAVWGVWNRKKGSLFFALLAVITFLLALGSLSPFRLLGLEPSLWFFSAPARWLLFTTFAGSILAGFGFDALENAVSVKRFFRIPTIVFVAILICGNICLWYGEDILSAASLSTPAYEKLSSMLESAKESSISFLSPYTYIPLVSLLLLPLILSHRQYKKILLGLTVIDLLLIASTTSPFVSWSTTLNPPEIISNLPENVFTHNARIYSLRDGGDTGAYFTDPESRADDAKREQQRQLLLPMMASQFGVYGVEWPASLDLLSQVKTRETLPQGAEEFGIGAILSADESGTIRVQELNAKPRAEVVEGKAEIISETPSSLRIKTLSSSDTTLIVRDTYYPGWRAYIDGQEVQIRQSEPFFRSVEVPIGEHIITMNYIPKMMYIGSIISLAVIGILLILSLRNLQEGKKKD